eukprot:SAG31_NODE_4248_length_3420_cov_1.946402_1_plen_379_part_00
MGYLSPHLRIWQPVPRTQSYGAAQLPMRQFDCCKFLQQPSFAVMVCPLTAAFQGVFGTAAEVSLNMTGAAAFRGQLYRCMIAQALAVKQDIEDRRAGRGNSFGLLVWSLNDIWSTVGWGSLEWGNPYYPGQALGGRWKPLHYWYKASIFADVFSTCDGGGKCFVRNDAPRPFNGSASITLTSFATGKQTELAKRSVMLGAGPGAIAWFHLDLAGNQTPASPCPAKPCGSKHPNRTFCPDGVPNQCDGPPRPHCPPCSGPRPLPRGGAHVMEAIVTSSSNVIMSHNVIPLAKPYQMELLPSRAQVRAIISHAGDLFANVTVSAVAMYVTLTTVAHGRFADNAFLLAKPYTRLVRFIPCMPKQEAVFASSLRVEDLSTYS